MIVLSEDGSLVVATSQGMQVSHDGCSFEQAAELGPKAIGDLTLDRSRPERILGYRLLGAATGGGGAELVYSADNARSWVQGARLEPTLYPLSIDVAPGDSSRVYVSALDLSQTDSSVLLRSEDGGESFERFEIDETSNRRLAYIAGVDPRDADRLYLRIDDGQRTQVLRSSDAGKSFELAFKGKGQLLGFAWSPDGSQVAVGGPGDGIWVGAADGSAPFESRSALAPSCLAWDTSGLYLCATPERDFSVARSSDEGRSWDAILKLSDLCGVSACPVGSSTEQSCAAAWPSVAQRLNTSCGVPAGAAAGGANADSPGSPATRQPSAGCSILAPGERPSGWLLGALLGLLCARARRRATRLVTSQPS